MGLTFVKVIIKNPQDPSKMVEEDFLVDSGALFTVVPSEQLAKIGIKSHRTQEFTLADGTKVKRDVGDAIFEYEGIRGACPVVFGKKGDSQLLGAFTLEALGLILDPFKRKLKPMRMLLV